MQTNDHDHEEVSTIRITRIMSGRAKEGGRDCVGVLKVMMT